MLDSFARLIKQCFKIQVFIEIVSHEIILEKVV